MTSFIEIIKSNIQKIIHDYNTKICSEYDNIDPKKLEEIWGSTFISNTSKPKSKSSQEQLNTCPYLLKKGPRKNEECGLKSINGMLYCSKHKKSEGTEPKFTKTIPSSKIIMTPNKTSTSIVPNTTSRILRKHKLFGCLWHSQTQMTFRSANERIVNGCIKNDNIEKLNAFDIEECKKWNFAYDPLCVEEYKEISDSDVDSLNITQEQTKLGCDSLEKEKSGSPNKLSKTTTTTNTKKNISGSKKENSGLPNKLSKTTTNTKKNISGSKKEKSGPPNKLSKTTTNTKKNISGEEKEKEKEEEEEEEDIEDIEEEEEEEEEEEDEDDDEMDIENVLNDMEEKSNTNEESYKNQLNSIVSTLGLDLDD